MLSAYCAALRYFVAAPATTLHHASGLLFFYLDAYAPCMLTSLGAVYLRRCSFLRTTKSTACFSFESQGMLLLSKSVAQAVTSDGYSDDNDYDNDCET
jgi:hypothetical protein